MGLLVAVVRAGVEMTMEGAQQAGRNGAVLGQQARPGLGPQSWKGSSGRVQGTQAGMEGRSEKHVAQICGKHAASLRARVLAGSPSSEPHLSSDTGSVLRTRQVRMQRVAAP